MSKKDQQAKLNPRQFKKSTNPITQALFQDGFCLTSPPNSAIAFFHDMREANITTTSGRYFKNSREHEELRESNRRGLQEIGDREINKLGQFLAREFRHVIPDEAFEEEYFALKDSWTDGVLDLFRNVANAALTDEYAHYEVIATENATLDFSEDAWHVEVVLSNLRLKHIKEAQSHALAGEIRTRFTLQLNGTFMLDQFVATTPFLNRLCFENTVMINANVLEQQNAEVTFDGLVAALETRLQHGIKDPTMQMAYQNVLDEIIALKDRARQSENLFEPLNNLLKQTLSFLDGEVDASVVESYKQTAAALGKTSFGKKLAIALSALLGLLLATLSIAAHVVTAGASAPLTIPGMIAGTAMFSASCFSFYQCWRKKSLERATGKLIPFVTVKAETTEQAEKKPRTTAEVHAHVLKRVDKIDEIIKSYQKR